MSIGLPREKIQKAVEDFWFARGSQAEELEDGGKSGGGARANGHLGTFTRLLIDLFIDAGIGWSDINSVRPYLPGYYRTRKQWDVVVTHRGHLVAAIELKSQVGAVAKNLNNRFEEALGTATDTLTAQRKYEAFGRIPPWLGYVLVLQEDAETEKKNRSTFTSPPFLVDDEFKGTSYNDRYKIMISRFLSDQIYNAGWFITTRNADAVAGTPVTFSEPLATATADTFAAAVEGRVKYIEAVIKNE